MQDNSLQKQSLPNKTIYQAMVFFWLSHFLVDFMLGVWPIFKTMSNIDLAIAGFTVAFGAFLGEGSQIIFGLQSDKGYRKPIIIFGLLCTVAATFLPLTTNYLLLVLIYLITSLGSGAFHPAAAGLVNSLNPAHRSLLITIFAMGGSLGLASSQLIFSYFHQTFNGITTWLAIPSVVLALFLLFYRLPKPTQVHPKKNHPTLRDLLALFKNRNLRALFIATVGNQAILWGLIFIFPDVLKALGHADWVCFGGGHSCLILGGTFMMIPTGYLADRYSPKTILLTISLIALSAFYFLMFFGQHSLLFTLVPTFILGAALSVFHPIALSLGTQYAPDHPSTVSAFLMGLVWCISESVGPGSVGYITTFFPEQAAIKSIMILGLLFIVQIYFLTNVKNSKRVTLAEA